MFKNFEPKGIRTVRRVQILADSGHRTDGTVLRSLVHVRNTVRSRKTCGHDERSTPPQQFTNGCRGMTGGQYRLPPKRNGIRRSPWNLDGLTLGDDPDDIEATLGITDNSLEGPEPKSATKKEPNPFGSL